MNNFAELPFDLQSAIIISGVCLCGVMAHQMWRLYKLLMMSANDKKIRSGVVIDTALPDSDFQIPDALHDYDILARQLGYTPFAAMSKNHTSTGIPPVIFYLYHSDDQITILRFPKRGEKVDFKVSLATWFENDSVITSSLPSRNRIESDMFIHRSYCDSIQQMHLEHQKTVALWVGEGRTPKKILTIDSYIERQAYFREHYEALYPLEIQRLARNLMLGKVVFIAASLLLLVSIYILTSLQFAGVILLAYVGSVGLHEKLRRDYVRWFDTPCKPATS